MAHRVKCIYCGCIFDRDTVDNQKIGRRYAHIDCYKKNYKADDDFKEKIYGIVKEVLGPDYDYPAIERQRKYYTKKGYSNEDIYKCLYYFYKVRNGKADNAKGRIGIVPYVFDEAMDYFSKKEETKMRMEKAEFQIKEVKIDVTKLIDQGEQKKGKIDLNSLE